jgi:hypothetical protein
MAADLGNVDELVAAKESRTRPTRIQAHAYGESRWFDTLQEAQEWVAEQEEIQE